MLPKSFGGVARLVLKVLKVHMISLQHICLAHKGVVQVHNVVDMLQEKQRTRLIKVINETKFILSRTYDKETYPNSVNH